MPNLEWKQQLDMVKGELDKSQAVANDNIEQANRAKSELEEVKERLKQAEGMIDVSEVLCMKELPPTHISSCHLFYRFKEATGSD